MMNTSSERVFYTVPDLYNILPIGRNSIYKLVNSEGFPKLTIGKRIVIPITQFWEYIEKNIGQSIEIDS